MKTGSIFFSVILFVSPVLAVPFEPPFFSPTAISPVLPGSDTPQNVENALIQIGFPVEPGARIYRSDLGDFAGFTSQVIGSVGFLAFSGDDLPQLNFLTLQVDSESAPAFVIFTLFGWTGEQTLRIENTFVQNPVTGDSLPIDHFTVWGEGTDVGDGNIPPPTPLPEAGKTSLFLGIGTLSMLVCRRWMCLNLNRSGCLNR